MVSLDDDLAYEAISYVWDNRDIDDDPSDELYDPRQIILQGREDVKISANLEAALRELRCLRRVRFLWADQLCIQQSNGEEKEAQIRLMDEIYKRARRVIIWLGVESMREIDFSSTRELFKPNYGRSNRRRRCGSIPDFSWGWFADAQIVFKFMKDMAANTCHPSIGYVSPWKRYWKPHFWDAWKTNEAFERFITRPYWARMWVVQEVTLGWRRSHPLWSVQPSLGHSDKRNPESEATSRHLL